MRTFVGAGVGLLLVAATGSVGSITGVAPGQISRAAPAQKSTPPISSKETGLRFTSKTIPIDRTTVRKNLIGMSSDGTFKFKNSSGVFGKLKPGKVMLLQGADALMVTGLGHSRGNLLVHTKPASFTDILSAGHITSSGAPDFRKAALHPIVAPQPKKKKAPIRFTRPGYPYVTSTPPPLHAVGSSPPSFSAQGKTGLYGYSLTFTPTSPTRLDVSGTLCFISFSVCGNGPSNGLSAEINMSGYIDAGSASGGITVNGGSVTHSSISLKSLAAKAHITYTISRGTGSADNGDPPILRVPIGIDYTIPGEIPIYLKLQTALLLKLGVSSKNAVIHGGMNFSTTGSDSLTQQGKQVSTSETGDKVSGQILDQSNGGVPPSISAAPSGTVVAVQFPKLGVGLGWTSVNGIAYVDVVTAVGQTTGSAFGGMFCSSYNVFVSVGGGFEAQIGSGKLGLALASQKKTLYEKAFKTHDPGCPQT